MTDVSKMSPLVEGESFGVGGLMGCAGVAPKKLHPTPQMNTVTVPASATPTPVAKMAHATASSQAVEDVSSGSPRSDGCCSEPRPIKSLPVLSRPSGRALAGFAFAFAMAASSSLARSSRAAACRSVRRRPAMKATLGRRNMRKAPQVAPTTWKTRPRSSTTAATMLTAATSTAASPHRVAALSAASWNTRACSVPRRLNETLGKVKTITATKAPCSVAQTASGSGDQPPGSKFSRRSARA
mmetsp:Transcript_41401/g.103099  ORF Transcript_41401/g.103099 Transcript_41401/m.103099 type:complete len:241 (+) Transcript_41401:200-922(+)